MPRVVSKHLFNYQLNGVIDEEVVALDKIMWGGNSFDPEMKNMKALVDSDDPSVNCEIVAKFVRHILFGMANMGEVFQGMIDQCVHTEFTVPIRDGNDYVVPVLVHTPKYLLENQLNAAMIYAHGGGCVGGEAGMFKGTISNFAIECGVVVFNVDYRLAPETKWPQNALDFYCAVKHIIENATKLGVDASKIGIAGDSGGGYVCFATMVMLAQKMEGELIKLAIPSIAMISDYCFGDLASMTKEEREASHMMRKIWRCISNDLDTEQSNPLLFPAKATDEILQRMPPTIIWENEFDIFITETTRMAHRMKTAGRLLEFRVQPGMTHASTAVPGTKGYKDNIEDYKLAIKEYLL